MSVPLWLLPDSQKLRIECGLQAHQIDLPDVQDDATFETHIEGVIVECAPTVASRVRRAAGQLFFPFSDATLAAAFPLESPEERKERGDDLAGTALEIVRQLTTAKLNYSVPGDFYQTKADGKWRSAMASLSELTKSIEAIEKQYQSLARVTSFFLPPDE